MFENKELLELGLELGSLFKMHVITFKRVHQKVYRFPTWPERSFLSGQAKMIEETFVIVFPYSNLGLHNLLKPVKENLFFILKERRFPTFFRIPTSKNFSGGKPLDPPMYFHPC